MWCGACRLSSAASSSMGTILFWYERIESLRHAATCIRQNQPIKTDFDLVQLVGWRGSVFLNTFHTLPRLHVHLSRILDLPLFLTCVCGCAPLSIVCIFWLQEWDDWYLDKYHFYKLHIVKLLCLTFDSFKRNSLKLISLVTWIWLVGFQTHTGKKPRKAKNLLWA